MLIWQKDKYDIEDEEILMAIRSHTTGRPGMSLLEKIVYIADYMEPGLQRAAQYDGCETFGI